MVMPPSASTEPSPFSQHTLHRCHLVSSGVERRKDTGLESEHLAFSPVYTNAARVALAQLFNSSVLSDLSHQIRVINT